jgi:ribokinase
MKVLNFGSLNLDYVYSVDHFVQPGETLGSLGQKINAGGKGLNQSVALAKAGAEVWHAGRIGAGGEPLRELLRENGVNVSLLPDTDEIQGNAVIQVNRAGENCILLFGGSNRCITPEQVRDTVAAFDPGDYLVLQNEINLLPLIVDEAYKQGLKIVLNPSPYDDSLRDVDFSKLSWLLVNEVEAGQLSGSEDPEKAWALIHEKYPSVSLLVTLGSAGSCAWQVTESGVVGARQEAFRVKAVDTTAAGDTFTGYFIGGLMEGRPLAECMRRASMASSIGVTRPGAAGSIPAREEVDAALS